MTQDERNRASAVVLQALAAHALWSSGAVEDEDDERHALTVAAERLAEVVSERAPCWPLARHARDMARAHASTTEVADRLVLAAHAVACWLGS